MTKCRLLTYTLYTAVWRRIWK